MQLTLLIYCSFSSAPSAFVFLADNGRYVSSKSYHTSAMRIRYVGQNHFLHTWRHFIGNQILILVQPTLIPFRLLNVFASLASMLLHFQQPFAGPPPIDLISHFLQPYN